MFFHACDGVMPGFRQGGARLARQGEVLNRHDPVGSTPAEFATRQKDDLVYWKQMIEYTGVKLE
jgi:hypothetical protein